MKKTAQFRRTKRPGEFRARCRAKRWAPLREAMDAATETTRSKWDARLKENVFEIRCDFYTEDRAAFEAHMKTAHGGALAKLYEPKIEAAENTTEIRTHQANLPVRPWRAPRLHDEGQPLKTKADVETCDGCGLVAEVDGTAASMQWWREHLKLCVYRTGQAAS